MESASKPPVPLPGTPLFPLSPDRINNAGRGNAIADNKEGNFSPGRSGFEQPGDGSPVSKGKTLSQHGRSNTDLSSPSKWRENPDFGTQSPTHSDVARQQLFKGHHYRTNSDVQCLVAQFNSLDIKDHERELKKAEEALKRAQMGREEAEEQLKRYREETRRLKRDNDEGAERERKMMKRLDAVMEDFHRAKETHAHAQSLYEKEIRRARKEAFKSSSALVKLQEELKATRSALRVSRADLEMERQKLARKDQDLFTAQYELVGEQERVKIIEQERDALKKSLEEEEVAKCAANGSIALPKGGRDDEFASPKKASRVPVSPTKQIATPGGRLMEPTTPNTVLGSKGRVETEQLHKELELEKRLRELAEDRVDFMKMECQFGCCSCRVAERKGLAFVHDGSLSSAVANIQFLRPMMSDALPGEEEQPPAYDEMDVDRSAASGDTKRVAEGPYVRAAPSGSTTVVNRHDAVEGAEEQHVTNSDHTSNDHGMIDPFIDETPIAALQERQQRAGRDTSPSEDPGTPASAATTATFTGAQHDSPPADSAPQPQDQHSAQDRDIEMTPGDEDGVEIAEFEDEKEEVEVDDQEQEQADQPYPATPNIRKTTTTTTIPLANTPSEDPNTPPAPNSHKQPHHRNGPITTPSSLRTSRTATSSSTTPCAGSHVEPTADTDGDVAEIPSSSRSHTPADFPAQLSPSKGLSREEAIEKLRAMRRDRAASRTEGSGNFTGSSAGLARSNSARSANRGSGQSSNASTPKRAVSHGRALAERPNGRTPSSSRGNGAGTGMGREKERRDVSAPEWGKRGPGSVRRR
ncbi:MAG: hypothetical protein M1831_001079 [Alyxoria varia]|nr:MAG: hypothetical protein M1831_001079 [Alyxoria varia]